jgi:hypothetical protein
MAAPDAASTKEAEEREIGDLAVWSLSTAKPGNGVEQLRDDNTDTYWQCARAAAAALPAPRRPLDALPSPAGRMGRSRT